MLLNAGLLIQDVQLLCFTVVFGVLALQRWRDPTRRWLWYSFLANSAGAALDLGGAHLPLWLGRSLDMEMIPLSYALLNIAIVCFDRRSRRAVWISAILLLAALPLFLAWRQDPAQIRNYALADLLIALECVVTTVLLLRGREVSTRAPRILMGTFLCFFIAVESARFCVAFLIGANPDAWPKLEIISLVTYIVNTSLLPLAFIWLMNARLESELLQQTLMDALTGVLNRRGLEQALEREMAHFRRYGADLTVAMLDLDEFKQLNDCYGHVAGDEVLIGLARLLRQGLRETDVVGRFGGDEFLIVLPHTDARESVRVLEKLRRAVREYAGWLPQDSVRASASFGASNTSGRRSLAAHELLREADTALGQSKQLGRDQVVLFSQAEPQSVAGLSSLS